MAGAGGLNPFPLRFGGGTTPTEDTYRMLRSAVGKGGDGADGSIVELWRLCKARGIAAVGTFDERAALQAFPDLATDLLPYYERLLFNTLDPIASGEARRAAVASRFTAQAGGNSDELAQDLVAIDSRFSVHDNDHDQTTTTQRGRAFQDLVAAEPFNGGRKSTAFPNYSTDFRFTAVLNTGGGDLDPSDRTVLLAAERHLSVVLPAWVFFQAVAGEDGFDLDTDPLDYTMLIP